MKNVSKYLSVGLIFICVACAKDSGNNPPAPGMPPVTSKPLPACAGQLVLKIAWNATNDAAGYVFEIGFKENNYFERRSLNEKLTSLEYTLDARGAGYFISMTRYDLNNLSTTHHTKFYVPTCKKREEWQKANPLYSEPIEINFIF
ncbi:MAG: hypothetical protein A2Z20_12695 [Bdellovibrionales bacterium RBG_16_40_8]|nr:MAG: hypothetical protein A2Z20_12695 [Bdellovibrionales bacterium RBG_16_40_8]